MCQRLYSFGIEGVSCALFAVWRLKLELVSDTHELNAVGRQFLFQPTPIVTSFLIVLLIVDSPHDVGGGELPFSVLLVPNSTNFVVIIKTYGFLSGHISLLFLGILSMSWWLRCGTLSPDGS